MLSEKEIEQRKNMRRSIVTASKLPKGHVLSSDDLTLKRPGTGIQPEELDSIIGRELQEDVDVDILLQYESLT